MAEEVRITDYDPVTGNDDNRVSEWEDGLPNGDDLTPLSQLLISPELLTAFNITPQPYKSITDVNRASQNTLANLRAESESGQPSLTGFDRSKAVTIDIEEDKEEDTIDVAEMEPATATTTEMDVQTDDPTSRALKRARLVWTPQLHKRFIEVVAHLGVKNAVPKTIMQLMNVEGLTRENVASHLQKYRLYLKRMQGASYQDGDVGLGSGSGSDHVKLHESGGSGNGNGNGYRLMPYTQQMVHHMPYQAQANRSWNGNGNGFDSGYQHGSG